MCVFLVSECVCEMLTERMETESACLTSSGQSVREKRKTGRFDGRERALGRTAWQEFVKHPSTKRSWHGHRATSFPHHSIVWHDSGADSAKKRKERTEKKSMVAIMAKFFYAKNVYIESDAVPSLALWPASYWFDRHWHNSRQPSTTKRNNFFWIWVLNLF